MSDQHRPILIRGGLVVDGTGGAARVADVLIDRGLVRAIEPAIELDRADAVDVIDAAGLVVTPGFVDPHTHLDAQIFWEPGGTPSAQHGVTTVTMSLCGFGIAPCAPGHEDYLLRSLESVEEIPLDSLRAGVPFGWRTWDEYMAAVAALPLGVNVAAFVPHSALRNFVLGERAWEPASESDIAQMVAVLTEALAAGAVGLSTSRGGNHVDGEGRPVPSRVADDDELRALVAACEGRVWQINIRSKSGDVDAKISELDDYIDWTRAANARLTWTPLLVVTGSDDWRTLLEHHRCADAADITLPQACPQPLTASFDFLTGAPKLGSVFGLTDELREWNELDRAGRKRLLDSAAVRQRFRAIPEGRIGLWHIVSSVTRPELAGSPVTAIGGGPVADTLLDLALADDLATIVQASLLNDDLAAVAELVADDGTLIGLGDSGAHVMSITSYAYPTFFLSTMVRDHRLLTLEDAVHRLTDVPARFLGLADRGVLSVGRPADVCVIDLDRLMPLPSEVRHDLPNGAPRLHQGASGYRAVFVNGRRTIADDQLVEAGSAGQRLSAVRAPAR